MNTLNMLAMGLALLFTAISPAHAAPTGTIEGELSGLGKGPFVVYVEKVAGTTYPPMNPPPVMGQKNNTYVPHILPILAGSKVEFRSSDPELHNIYAWALALNKALFNVALPPSAPPNYQTFAKEGIVRMTCNVHKEMLAFILVLQNPHFALLEKTKQFKLTGVPAGKHVLRVWGEKLDDAAKAKQFPVEVSENGTAKVSIQ